MVQRILSRETPTAPAKNCHPQRSICGDHDNSLISGHIWDLSGGEAHPRKSQRDVGASIGALSLQSTGACFGLTAMGFERGYGWRPICTSEIRWFGVVCS